MLLAYDMPMNRWNQLLLYGLFIAFLYLFIELPTPVCLPAHFLPVRKIICIPF